MEGINQVIEMANQTSVMEWIAVLCLVIYIWLIARENVIAWPFGIIGSAIYIWICFSAHLFLDAGLQVFYVAFGIIGWVKWTGTGNNTEIQHWPIKKHLIWLLIGGISTLLLGWLATHYTSQQSPYIDAFIFVFSLIATYLTAEKILENWVYWIVVDAVAIGLFYSKGLYLTSLLYVIYTVLALFGWIKWKSEI